jgi:GxxExxY protein
MEELPCAEESHAIRGSIFDVNRVELNAVRKIAPEREAQLLDYLKATGMRPGLLVNFGSYPNSEVERRIL